MSLAKGLPMYLSFQITSSWCIDLFCDVLSLFYFALIFILCPLPLVSFVLFPGSFRCKIRLYVWGFSCLLRWACITIKFPLRTLLLYTTVFFVCVWCFPIFIVFKYFLFPLISSVTPGLCMAYCSSYMCFCFLNIHSVSTSSCVLRETDLYKQRQRMETEGEIIRVLWVHGKVVITHCQEKSWYNNALVSNWGRNWISTLKLLPYTHTQKFKLKWIKESNAQNSLNTIGKV